MGLRIKLDKENVKLNKAIVTSDSGCIHCILQSDEKENIKVQMNYTLGLPDIIYNIKDYSLYIFKGDKVPENNIFQVYEKYLNIKEQGQGRIGWTFPLQALLSNEHDYANNLHFLRYAYVAFNKLISLNENLSELIPDYKPDTVYTLGDFYKDNLIIMILCNESLSKIDNFRIENYLPSLYSKGYYFFDSITDTFENEVILEKVKNKKDNIPAKRLTIESVSKQLNEGTYINRLFIDLLKNEKHYLVKFHLLYQVVELLIERIFNNEIKRLFKEIECDSCNLFEIRNEFSKLAEELARIEKLFTTYTNDVKDLNCLKEACISLLVKTGNEKDLNQFSPGKNLYTVRNLLVHNYRLLSIEHVELINEINSCFENVVIDILIRFKEGN